MCNTEKENSQLLPGTAISSARVGKLRRKVTPPPHGAIYLRATLDRHPRAQRVSSLL